MGKKYTNYILFIFLSLAIKLPGQTPYLSQNFAAINYFNPASVGFGVNNQMNIFYKNQFAGVGDAYKTIGVSADFKLFNANNEVPNNFGMGIHAVSEQVLNGLLQSNYISVDFANRVFLNKQQTSYLSLGIGGTIISTVLDKSQLTFGDQYYSGRLFNASSAETFGSIPIRYTTNVGLLYGNSTPTMFMQIGASTYYINRSALNQIYNNVNQSFQFIGLLNFEHAIWEDKTILLHADYQNRLESEYYYAGLAMGFPIQDNNAEVKRFYLGCFYRVKDAIIPYAGLRFSKYKIGLSYDIYQNNMTSSNLHPQTIEFNLSTYLSKWKSEHLANLFN